LKGNYKIMIITKEKEEKTAKKSKNKNDEELEN